MRREYSLFIVLNFIGLGIALAFLGFGHYVLKQHSPLATNIWGNVIGTGMATFFRFWAYKKFVFLHPDHPKAHAAAEPAARRRAVHSGRRGREQRRLTGPARLAGRRDRLEVVVALLRLHTRSPALNLTMVIVGRLPEAGFDLQVPERAVDVAPHAADQRRGVHVFGEAVRAVQVRIRAQEVLAVARASAGIRRARGGWCGRP